MISISVEELKDIRNILYNNLQYKRYHKDGDTIETKKQDQFFR